LNATPAGNRTPIARPTEDSLDACLAACEGNLAWIAYTFESGVCKLFGPANARRQATGAQGGAPTGTRGAQGPTTGAGNPAVNPATFTTQVGTHAAPLNAQPAGAPAPIATPKVDDLAACLAACLGNPSCIAYPLNPAFATSMAQLSPAVNNKVLKVVLKVPKVLPPVLETRSQPSHWFKQRCRNPRCSIERYTSRCPGSNCHTRG
jgi:hypothetical protein